MVYITDTRTNILVEGDELNSRYPYNGVLTIPYNSTLVIVGEYTDMVTFKSVANFDTQFTAIIGRLYIQGELVTKENVIEKFNAIANVVPSSSGGTSADLSNYYTKDEVDYLLSTVDGGEGVGCCSTILTNQANIISMLESLTNDHTIINNMVDSINGEELDCTNEEADLINEINGDEITC